MIKALSPYAAQESFADRVGFWRAIRRFHDFNPTAGGHLCEGVAIFTIAIANQETWPLTVWRGLA